MRADGGDPASLTLRIVSFVVHPRHVYVHVPFCARRCAYCDFSIAVRAAVPADEYVVALRRELDMRFAPSDEWLVDTLYFGGGTPSRLGAAGIADLLTQLRTRLALTEHAEVTLEANPEDITADAVAAWRAAGINRLSIGAQSFDDRVLAWMHRTHDADSTERAVATARQGGIENFSLDLIFALPESLERSWTADVERALALEPAHLSLYGLTIEPHTPLGRWRARGDVQESPDERYEAEFLEAHDRLESAGFEHYEVSNFGRRGMRSRHNSSYWSGAAYTGLGPSAHEFDGSVRRWNTPAYTAWLGRLQADQDPVEETETLSSDNRTAEQVYLGLRTMDGLAVSPAEVARAKPWVDAGWAMVRGDGRLVLTALGWLRLDALAADLTLVRSR